MVKAHEAEGFKFIIRNPPREHGPAHVHVEKAGAEVVINLEPAEGAVLIRDVYGMRSADVVKAVRLVEANLEVLLETWRRIHGSPT